MTQDRDRDPTIDYVLQLTTWHTEHQRPTRDTRAHTTRVPPLLEQLAASDTPSRAANGGDSMPGYESRPAARLEAIDALADVTRGARQRITALGAQPRHHSARKPDERRSTAAVRAAEATTLVQQLGGLLRAAVGEERERAESEIRHWWITARIITGWDSPPWTPDNTCPACGELRALRIRLADQLALCTGCQATWNAATLGVLAEHIRTEAAERAQQRGTSPGRSPCWCPLPRPIVADLSQTCPVCGSARCHHAVAARELAAVRRRLVDADAS